MRKNIWKQCLKFGSYLSLGILAGVSLQACAGHAQSEVSMKTDQEHFILDKSGNAFEMKAKLGNLVGKYKSFSEIDRIIRKDNPDVKYSKHAGWGPREGIISHRWDVSRQRFLRVDIYIAHVTVDKNGKIIDYGCNRGSL